MIPGLKRLGGKVAIGLLIIFAGAHALAAGSLAIDTLQGDKYGFSFNHPSAELADQRSMRECGADCSVVLRFSGQCGAYAADQARGSNAYGWGTGGSSSATQARAMSECRAKGGSSCKVRAWGCDAISPAQQQSPTQSSAQSAQQPNAQPSRPAAPSDSARAGSGFSMQGDWLVDYVSASGYTANGSLRVTDNLGNGNFRGLMVLAYTTSGGEPRRVQQNASISVRGDTVVVSGSNPVYLQGTGNYSADSYTLTVGSPNLLRGKNSDASGNGGVVVISRR
ncbi:MAG: DUF4189 domain-containing protein [Pseudomonadota bacterium]